MTTITYTDHDNAAPRINWQGREFVTTVPVEVDPEEDARLIEAAKANRYFEVEEKGKAPTANATVYAKGYSAAGERKPRSVPVAYRGKPEAEAWLFGYDERMRDDPPAPEGSGEPEVVDVVAQGTAAAASSAAPTSPSQAGNAAAGGTRAARS